MKPSLSISISIYLLQLFFFSPPLLLSLLWSDDDSRRRCCFWCTCVTLFSPPVYRCSSPDLLSGSVNYARELCFNNRSVAYWTLVHSSFPCSLFDLGQMRYTGLDAITMLLLVNEFNDEEGWETVLSPSLVKNFLLRLRCKSGRVWHKRRLNDKKMTAMSANETTLEWARAQFSCRWNDQMTWKRLSADFDVSWCHQIAEESHFHWSHYLVITDSQWLGIETELNVLLLMLFSCSLASRCRIWQHFADNLLQLAGGSLSKVDRLSSKTHW